MKTSLKEVKVTARYAHKTNGKLNGLVTYAVRSSGGTTLYCTTLINGKASGCSCPSKCPCYHEKQLEAIEAERVARQQEARTIAREDEKLIAVRFATENLPAWATAMVSRKMLSVPTAPVAMDLPEELKGRGKVARSVDLSTKGDISSNKGFSILKIA